MGERFGRQEKKISWQSRKEKQAVKNRCCDKSKSIRQKNQTFKITYQKAKYQKNPDVQLAYKKCGYPENSEHSLLKKKSVILNFKKRKKSDKFEGFIQQVK